MFSWLPLIFCRILIGGSAEYCLWRPKRVSLTVKGVERDVLVDFVFNCRVFV